MVDVLVASWLEPEQVARIVAAAPGLDVLYEPELLPRPRYPSDHNGAAPDLSPAQLDTWQALLARAEVAFDVDWWRPAELPVTAPRLRWVQLTSAGVGAFLTRTGLDRSGIAFSTAAGVHAVPLAEFVVAGLLQIVKDLPTLKAWQDARHWERHATGRLAGRRALVVGLGGIGREVVRVLDALGVATVGLGRAGRAYDVPGLGGVVDPGDLDDVLPTVDIVVLACPLTPETENLLDRRRIGLLPSGAGLVNIGRGRLLDQDALCDALVSGALGGAVLDVTAPEPPPPGDRVWRTPRLLLTPHVSCDLPAGYNAASLAVFFANFRAWRAGAALPNRVDVARGY